MEPIEFGDYLLLKKLASGGMGEVHLARQVRGAGFDRYLAIKRILPELTGDDEFVRMFLDEARLAAHLTHPNVVEIHDLGICGDQYFIAMEFLEGRDLRRVMSRLSHRQRALPGAHAIHVIHHAAEGLHHAHELTDPSGKPRGIIHRDVSPQNIFITFHGTVKVLDFGIAKAESRSVQTRTGGLKGKYPYMSPEQVRGEAIDRRSDIFSLGVVLWETTVGRRLFRRENDLLTLNAVLKCEVPSPSSLMDRYPPELEAIVLRALAKDPEARYPSCRALQEDLEGFMAQYGLLLSPQKLGRSVTKLFSDEPCTVTEIVESLKEKPQTRSLLRDDEPDSDDRSGAVVHRPARGEASETSSPSGSVAAEPYSQSIPGLGGVPVQGFEAPEAASASDSSSGPSTSGVVEVSWSPESDSDPDGAVDIDRVAAEPAAATNEDDEPRTAENLVPDGFEVSRLQTGRQPAVASPPEAPDTIESGRERADPSGIRDPAAPSGPAAAPDAAPPLDPWLASVPTAVNEPGRLAPPVADRPTSRPRPLAPPGASAIPLPAASAGLSTRTMALLLVAAAVVLVLLLVLVVPLLAPPSPRGRAAPPSDQGAAAGAERPGPAPRPDPPPETPPAPPPPVPEDAGAEADDAHGDAHGDADWTEPEQDAAALGEDADAASTAPSGAPPERPSGTRVTLATAPSGLSLYTGGRRLGTSPVTLRLAPGSHSIRVQSKALGVDFTTSVRVPSQDGSRELIAVPQGTLALKVRPYAEVFVDGRRLGLTPMPPAKLYIGRRHVRLVNDSLGRTVTRTVEIRPGERAVLTVDMGAAP